MAQHSEENGPMCPQNGNFMSNHYNNNGKEAYVNYGEICTVEKAKMRGRKTFAFWTLVVLLVVLAITNLLLTVAILSVLKIGRNMESIELISEEDTIKFFGETDFGHLYKRNGRLEGFKYNPVEIEAQNGAIILSITTKSGRLSTKLKIDANGTIFSGLDQFIIRSKSNKIVYSTTNQSFNALKKAKNLKSRSVHTNRVSANKDLRFDGKLVNLKGAEGTLLDGKMLDIKADQDVHIKSINGSVVLKPQGGVIFVMDKLPKGGKISSSFQYKVCVCMPQGKFFRVPVSNTFNSCSHINMQDRKSVV